jgi:hypothetical protein
MTLSPKVRNIRELIVLSFMVLLFFFWAVPVTTLAGFLSYKEIKKTLPWLAKLIDSNETIRAVVQNSLPSLGMVILNAALPFLLEGKHYENLNYGVVVDLLYRTVLSTRIPGAELD